MKKITLALTLLVTIMMASCSKKQSSNLIPEDAVFVMRVDPMKTLDTAGASGKESKLKKQLKKMVKDMGGDKELRQKLEDIIDDPTASGIDFSEPFFFYAASVDNKVPELGVVGTVASQDDITELLEAADATVEDAEQGGVKYFMPDSKSVFIFSSEWFYAGTVSTKRGSDPDIEGVIETLMERAGGKGSLADNKAFQTMCDKEGVAQSLLLGQGFASISEKKVKQAIKEIEKALPGKLKVEDIAVLNDLSIDKGEIVTTLEAVALSDEWQGFIDRSMKDLKDVDSKLAKYISLDGICALANIDMKDIYKRAEKFIKKATEGDDELETIEMIAKSVTGEAAFEVYNWDKEKGAIAVAYVGARNDDMLKLLNKEGVAPVTEGGRTLYKLPTDYDYVYDNTTGDYDMKPVAYANVGYDNGAIFIAQETDQLFQTPSGKKASGNVKGQGFYARVNADFIKNILMETAPYGKEAWEPMGDIVDYVEAYIEDGKIVSRLTTKDKSKNPVAAIIEYAMGMMNN